MQQYWQQFRYKTPDKILSNFNIHDPPFDVLTIARRLNIELIFVKNAGWSGACQFTDKNAKIFLSLEEDTHRTRFTCAHQLGHVINHPLNSEFRDWTDPCAINLPPKELDANDFAFKILMPEWSVRVSVDYIGSKINKLAPYFNVSELVMEYRLRQLYC